MAMNPMQRKANNYLLIGVLVTLLITGSIIAILFMQLSKLNNQIKAHESKMKNVYVVSKDIKSGEEVSTANLKQVSAVVDAVPNDAVTALELTDDTIAKIDLKVGTVITSNMVTTKEEQTTDDVRTQEYNMISLPTQIQTGDYIDVRLKLPDGTDYIVLSKKKVEIPTIDGIESADTIKINVAENEILTMSNAIVEAYWATGSILYATTYTEPGIQGNATPTYLPNDKVISLINADPNIVSVARTQLRDRYNSTSGTIRGNIVNVLNDYAEDAQTNIETKVQEEITKAKEERQSYLEALGGY